MRDYFHNNQNREEKRKHLRKEVITNVSYKVLTPSCDIGRTQNISEGGVCFLLNKELYPGAILEVNFKLPSKDLKTIKTFVKVAWQKKTYKGFFTGTKFGI